MKALKASCALTSLCLLVSGCFSIFDRVDARTKCGYVANGLEAYYQVYHEYPTNLAELNPRFLDMNSAYWRTNYTSDVFRGTNYESDTFMKPLSYRRLSPTNYVLNFFHYPVTEEYENGRRTRETLEGY